MYIESIIFFYAYICICVVVFDIVFIMYIRSKDKSLDRKIRWTKYVVDKQIDDKPEVVEGEEEVLELKNITNLMALQKVVEALEDDEASRYLGILSKDLEKLARVYSTKSSEDKAYFAYFIYTLQLGKRNADQSFDGCIKAISKVLYGFMKKESLYIKENTFKAIVSLGDCESICNLIRLLEQSESHYNEKLLSENLLRLEREHQKLADILVKDFDKYSANTQTAIVNYLRLLPVGEVEHTLYYSVLYDYLKDKKANTEVRIALMRYFKKYPYEPVKALLIGFVKEQDEQMWALAAVAAATLQSYSGQEVISALRHATYSAVWYIRFNASESLIALGEEDKSLMMQQDRYASEMIAYRQSVKVLKTEGGSR